MDTLGPLALMRLKSDATHPDLRCQHVLHIPRAEFRSLKSPGNLPNLGYSQAKIGGCASLNHSSLCSASFGDLGAFISTLHVLSTGIPGLCESASPALMQISLWLTSHHCSLVPVASGHVRSPSLRTQLCIQDLLTNKRPEEMQKCLGHLLLPLTWIW